MSDSPYFVITIASCEADYRQTALSHFPGLAQDLMDQAGALVVRYGVVATGDNVGALAIFQAYEHLDGFEKALDVYAGSTAYAEVMSSGKVQVVLRNIMKTHPVPFDQNREVTSKYAVLTRASSADPMISEMSQLAELFAENGALTLRYGTLITGNNAGNRLVGATYPSMEAIEKTYDALAADAHYAALLSNASINMRGIIRLIG